MRKKLSYCRGKEGLQGKQRQKKENGSHGVDATQNVTFTFYISEVGVMLFSNCLGPKITKPE